MNSKHLLYKEKLRVEEEIYSLEVIQRNQNWVELVTPYKSGYYKSFDLRDDIKRRDDAWVFYECIRLVGGTIWGRDKSFKQKKGKGKYEYLRPTFGEISAETYDSLNPAVRKHFSPIGIYHKKWNPFRKVYSCGVPTYYFVEKIEPRWITHYKEHDSVIARAIDEKEDYLCQRKFWPVKGWYGTAPKSYCKSYTRSDRRHSKQTVYKNITSGGEDYDKYEYRYAHKHSATWDYW